MLTAEDDLLKTAEPGREATEFRLLDESDRVFNRRTEDDIKSMMKTPGRLRTYYKNQQGAKNFAQNQPCEQQAGMQVRQTNPERRSKLSGSALICRGRCW